MFKNFQNKLQSQIRFKSVFTIIALSFFLLAANSCNKEFKPEKGGIDLISNVYVDASKGLNKVQNFHISRLNYLHDDLIEVIPDLTFPEITDQIFYIKDSLCFKINSEQSKSTILSEIYKTEKPILTLKKQAGAIFSDEWIPNYLHRKNISDTVLFKKNYKRFEINSKESFSRFYIYPTDTILPYSIYRHAEKDYGGRLERIDSYNKKKDVFVTLQLITRKNWDNEAKEIFDFNAFVKKKK
ncbi:hypothetical protein [Halpernia sp.]|uniref:hypothetical protein n=1 Tax=Halpernia sp. TaxID=2782209 RepID=UPI003A92A3B8